MKVRYANKIFQVLYAKEVAGLTMYAVEDEPNHVDWLINVEVIDAEEKLLRKIQKPDLDNTNGTYTIKFEKELKEEQGQIVLYGLSGSVPEQPKEELTEFETKVKDLLGYRQTFSKQDVKEELEILLSLARKQIAEEIDVEDMVFHASKAFVYDTDTNNAYRQGIKDILKLISNDKGKEY